MFNTRTLMTFASLKAKELDGVTRLCARRVTQRVRRRGACKLFCVNTGGSVIGDRAADHQIQS